MLFKRKKKPPDKTTLELFASEVERQAQKRAEQIMKTYFGGSTGSDLLAAAIAGDEELLMTGGRRNITQFKGNKAYADKYEGVVWVYICVNRLAENLSGVPLLVVDPETQESIDHPFQAVLEQPNPDLTMQELLERTIVNLETSGKVLWELRKNGLDNITQIYVLEGWRIEAIPAGRCSGIELPSKTCDDREITGFKYQTDEKDASGKPKYIDFTPEEALYYRYFNPLKPHEGLSPIAAAQLHLQADLYATIWNKTFFENDTEPRGVLETDKDILQEEADWLRSQFEKKHKHHGVSVLPKGIKYRNTTVSHSDMDFLQQQKSVRNIVCAIYGVPLPVVGFYDSETGSGRSAGVEQYMERFWTQTLIPKMRKLLDGMNESLGRQFDPPINFAFDLDGVEALQGNQLEMAKAAKMMVGTGLSWNEIRQKAYGASEVPGMDWIPVPANVMPAGDIPIAIESDGFIGRCSGIELPSSLPVKKKLLMTARGVSGRTLSPKLLPGKTSFSGY